MTSHFEEEAQKAMQNLMQSSLKKMKNENVLRAMFGAAYAEQFDTQYALWRTKWLNFWLFVGVSGSLIGLISWSAAMMPRLGFFNIDDIWIGLLLALTVCSTIVTVISAIGIVSISQTPKLSRLVKN